jgi:hypothetical protein
MFLSSGIAYGQKEDASAKFAALITPASMKQKLTILAGPEMEGRETAMPGERKAAAYIESEFKKTKHYWQNWVKHCSIPIFAQKQQIRSALCLKLHQFQFVLHQLQPHIRQNHQLP